MNLNLNSKVSSKASTPATKPQERFFTQFTVLPPTLQGGPWQIVAMQDSGISPRDYFAAAALNGISIMEASLEHAEWCYRVADAMLKARARANPDGDNSNGNGGNDSQFHGDHMK